MDCSLSMQWYPRRSWLLPIVGSLSRDTTEAHRCCAVAPRHRPRNDYACAYQVGTYQLGRSGFRIESNDVRRIHASSDRPVVWAAMTRATHQWWSRPWALIRLPANCGRQVPACVKVASEDVGGVEVGRLPGSRWGRDLSQEEFGDRSRMNVRATRDLDRGQAELPRRAAIALLASAPALCDAKQAAFTTAAVDLAGPIGEPWGSGSPSWVR
jgi:hypothetical protein